MTDPHSKAAPRKTPREQPAVPPAASSDVTIFVVDDDPAVRDSLEFLMESVGLRTRCFDSAEAFLSAAGAISAAPGNAPAARGCLLLDVRMPGMSGLDLQELLVQHGLTLPIIILTGHADVPMAVRAMRAGALDFIEKPCNQQVLLDRIHQALALQSNATQHENKSRLFRARIARLSPREQEVMALVVAGHANKTIADELGVTVKTVEVHRSRVMEKMEAESLPDLVRMSLLAGGESGEE